MVFLRSGGSRGACPTRVPLFILIKMSVAQRMERQFFLSFIDLINEVQGIQKLPSQLNFNRKSSWMKQISNPRQKKDALARI